MKLKNKKWFSLFNLRRHNRHACLRVWFLSIALFSLSCILLSCVLCFLFFFLVTNDRMISSCRFVITIEAKVGGVKNGDNTQAGGRFYTPQYITMDPSKNTTIRTTKFAFDLETPYHCLSTMNNCSVFPIFLNRSMTNVSLTSTGSRLMPY